MEKTRYEALETKRTVYEHVRGFIVRFGEDLINPVRKITYPLVLISAVMPQQLEAADIEKTASFSEGVEALKEGVFVDGHETGAEYIQTENGGLWVSTNGDTDSVTYYGQRTRRMWQNAINELGVAPGETVKILKFHTHPVGVTEYGPTTSHPPSIGSIDSFSGDTHPYQASILETNFIEPVEQATGVEIISEQYVVDAFGIWSYGQYDEAHLAQEYPQFAKTQQQEKNTIERYLHLREKLDASGFIKIRVQQMSIAEIKQTIYQARDEGLINTNTWRLIREMDATPTVGTDDMWASLLVSAIERGEVPDIFAEDFFSDSEYVEYPVLEAESSLVARKTDERFGRLLGIWLEWKEKTNAGRTVQELIDNGTYEQLVRAYAEEGILVSYKPFVEASK